MGPAPELPVQETVTSQAVGLEELARRLAEGHASTKRGRETTLLKRLDELEAVLRRAQQHFASEADQKLEIPSDAEWLLDNYYLIHQAVRQVREDLPEGFYRQLPIPEAASTSAVPRIYSLARELTSACEIHLDPDAVRGFVAAYQTVTPLTMGELWALPTMLRLATLERLTQGLAATLEAQSTGYSVSPAASQVHAKGNQSIVAGSVLNLRALDVQDWKGLFESVSRVEQILRRDPAQVYARMDFDTRDRYRKVVEHLAWSTGASEEALAQHAVELAAGASRLRAEGRAATATQKPTSHQWSTSRIRRPRKSPEPQIGQGGALGGREAAFSDLAGHVGFYLLDQGRAALESRLGYSPSPRTRIRRWLEDHALLVYLAGIAELTLLVLIGSAALVLAGGGSLLQVVVAELVALVPAVTVAVSLVHSIISRLVPPRLMPKMEFQEGIPGECSTLVAIPAMLTSPEDIRALLGQLEQHYLSTVDENLHFALLTDFSDAPREHMPGDEALLTQAREGVHLLNQKHGLGRRKPFHLFHRARAWNPREGAWIGWERKRGKLVELSALLAGEATSSYVLAETDEPLPKIRFVITLDADSALTRGGARRLIATLAHPLNQAEFDPHSGALTSGYTLLQPRVRVKPTSVNRTFLSRLLAGDRGLDLYTQAVSDLYQDLFGEGSYVGKGIIDFAAFRRSLAGRVPENALLSHDLFEGLLGRAGLVTDVVLLEDFPAHYLAYAQRWHRWTRGDWQLLPWLLPRVPTEGGGTIPNDLSVLDRWKILDNLRRSLLAPFSLALLVLGWFWLPGPPVIWTLFGVLAQGAPLLAGMALGVPLRRPATLSLESLRPLWMDLARWLLALTFLPYEGVLSLDAIGRTLVRLTFTRRRLLQWITAASIARLFSRRVSATLAWRRMATAPILAVALGLLAAWLRPSLLVLAGPFMLAWLVSPQIAQWISRPVRYREPAPTPAGQQQLHSIARRTWLFFERFVGPDDHWLPPDHFQESPRGQAAHHTSPTNIGFLLLSCLAANDLGYLGLLGLALRLNSALDAMDELDRHRGHFLNWYDTRTLAPLAPRYVSTVDSGNLAGCLMALSQSCLTMPDVPVFRWERWQGLLDTLGLLGESLAKEQEKTLPSALQGELAEIRRQVQAVEGEPARWAGLLESLSTQEMPVLDSLLMQLIEIRPQLLSPETLESLRLCSERVRHHLKSIRRELDLLLPWILLLNHPPAVLSDSRGDLVLHSVWRALLDTLPPNAPLGEVARASRAGEALVSELWRLLERACELQPGQPTDDRFQEALAWCTQMASALQSGRLAAESLVIGYGKIGERAEALVQAMDFGFLFDARQQVFHIGYNLDAGRLEENHYDLLASEARLASLVAIAKRDVPLSHWLHLGRPLTRANGSLTLLSWSGTMFEYLMPLLLMRNYPGTLLDHSCRAAVQRQISFAGSRGAPWGVSESGYYAFDASQNYQYRAFGVPGLGLKRGLGDDLVVAPYASLLALPLATKDVLDNYARLLRLEMVGPYGLYEALDCTPSRVPMGQSQARVRSYMAHHHGMTLVALANVLRDDLMVRRFHSDPRIQTVELLLQEQLPVAAPVVAVPAPAVTLVRPERAQVSLTPWREPARAATPRAHFLSNGRYGVMITSAGSGYSQWQGCALTRWAADTTLDDWGTWIYIKDRDTGSLGSATFQPVASASGRSWAFFYPHLAEFHHEEDGLAATMEVAVAAEDDVEIRRLALTNQGERRRRLTVASYSEVVLAPQAVDQRHPAFNKLFIESEFLRELSAILFRRRPRSADEEPIHLIHMLVSDSSLRQPVAVESDRARFVGRGRSPRSPLCLLGTGRWSLGRTGATLDPIMALGQDIELEPGATVRLDFITLAGRDRSEVLDLARRYQALPVIDRAFDLTRERAERELREEDLVTEDLECLDRLLSGLLYPNAGLRAPAETLATNCRGQHGLWGFGISGDYPVLLVRVKAEEETPLVRDVLRAHAYWRRRGIKVDVVIRVDKETGYGQQLQGELYRLIVRMGCDPWLNQRGGIFIMSADQMAAEDRVLLETAARAILDGSRGSLVAQLGAPIGEPVRLPAFIPTLPRPEEAEPTPELPRPSGLSFDNGRGGFTPDGSEYQIYLGPGEHTPMPWINVIANPRIGFTVSEAGAGLTWVDNSSENRLTPWSNDPVRDTPGEAIYLRDEETALIWSPTPMPAPTSAPYLVRHGTGYTVFEHHSHGLKQQLRVFVVPNAPVKVIALRLENLWQRPRRVTATYYAQWALGTSLDASAQYVVPEYEPDANALLARNPYNPEFADRYAFLAASQRPHGLTADRTEFLGRMEGIQCPAALQRVGLAGTVRAGLDPCAAIQLHVDLASGEAKEVYFLLGQGAGRDEAVRLARQYGDPTTMEAAWHEMRASWENLLGAVTAQTPDPAVDLMLNRWLLYQAISCRMWGRTALYQSSGAFGFRDQLQDAMALIHTAPSIAREHLLEAARHQFKEGDVLHWWHAPSGRGIRTRCSDDLLWLPFVTAHYVEATGDEAALSENIPFLEGDPLQPDETERYGLYASTLETHPLYEHCRRALERGLTAGAHGLPLIGTGDWNDGLNRVGAAGRGESVWLGWFLHATLIRFGALSERIGRADQAAEYRRLAGKLCAAVESAGWDGKWYRRAYYDDGQPLGSSQNEEWRIDSVAQSWAVLSGAADPKRAEHAMRQVKERLLEPDEKLILLAAPPFDKAPRDPGYVKGYPPGVRENGGAYQHAAMWTVWAFLELGWTEEAYKLFQMLNPINRSDTPEKVRRYQVEPYVVAGDISSQETRVGRGGWTWYTGSAAWMYRLGLEGILGLRRVGDHLEIVPRVPTAWPGYHVRYRYGRTIYEIDVQNEGDLSRGVKEVRLDGKVLPDRRIPLEDDGKSHKVRVVCG